MTDQERELLRECLASGQMSAAQAVQHFEAGELDAQGSVSPTMTPLREAQQQMDARDALCHEAPSTSSASPPLLSLRAFGRSELPRGLCA